MKTGSGKLILIGCGPGATDLLTLRAANRIREADLVLYDRLIEPGVLDFVRPGADRLYVGKAPGDGGIQQAGLNQTIETALRAGRTVARLKSGDPMVFGRAVEEIEVAVSASAEVEIVPGVTAALAAAADAGIAVTERAEIQSFIVTTGRAADADTAPDWARLMKPGVCVAFYMGVAEAWRIQSALMAAGVPASAPAVWVEQAGRSASRNVETVLGRLAHDAVQAGVSNPAILFVRYPYSLAAEVASARVAAAG